MDFFEKTMQSEEKFQGRILRLRVDTVELPNGSQSTREIIEHPGGVGVVAVDADDMIYLVRQFRKPYDQVITEIPAGKLDAGEDPRECGIRELSEETGLTAGQFISLGEIYPSPGYAAESLYLYLALDLSSGTAHLDADEFLEVEKLPLSKAAEMAMSGELKDAKTVVGILKALRYLGK